MISKKTFIDTINFILNKRNQEDRLCSILEELSGNDTYCDAWIYSEYESQMINLLKESLCDTNGDIDYYLYEYLDFSAKTKADQLEETPWFKSIETLYDYLKNKMEAK